MDSHGSPSRLSILGPVDLRKADGTPVRSILAQPKRVALLAFIRMSEQGRPVTRDAVLRVFWPDLPEERALSALRQGIHFLRRSLGADAVERTGDHALHVPEDRLWCDAAEFERLAELERHEEAVALHRGPFLDGLPVDGPHALEDWIERTRARLRTVAVRSAGELSEAARRAGQAVAAADWARWLLELDPLEERGAALLIEAHAATGDPVAAVRALNDYEERLGRELGISPSPALRERVEQLRELSHEGSLQPAGRAPAAEASPAAEAPADPAASVPAEEVAGPDPAAPDEEGSHGRSHTGGIRRPARRLVGALILAGLAAVLAFSLPWPSSDSGDSPDPLSAFSFDLAGRPSVAVLPFANLSPDSANAFFAAGVHESVLVTLSKIGSIDVSSLQAVRGYQGPERSLAQIADELRVRTILSGSVQRDADRVRIIVRLVDPSAGTQLWSEAYTRRLDDVFGVQADIARSVAASLSAVLTPIEESRIARAPTRSLTALDHFMRGREAYTRLTLSGMNDALRFYQLAVAEDPGFAAAWTGIADALLQRVQFFGYPLEWADSARTLVEHAIALDPELPEAYKTLGFVHSVNGRQRAALDAAEHALRLRPAYADALNNAGWSRYFLGDLVEAERLIGRSFRLQPTIPQLRSNVGAIWAVLGRVDEAEAWLDAVLASDPGLTATRTWRVFVDIERARPGEALQRAAAYLRDETPLAGATARAAFAALLAKELDQAAEHARVTLRESPGVDVFDLRRMETVLGLALREAGSRSEGEGHIREAIRAVDRAVQNGADGWDPPMELAAAHAALDDPETSLRHLERAVQLGFPHAQILRLDPTFDRLRDHARFVELVDYVERRSAQQRRESREGPG